MNAAAPHQPATWLGHPKGLFFLAFTEMWERFSFYGMRALLILYMVQELLVSARVDQIAGMEAYRAFIEAVFGELSTQAFASQTFGLYVGFVYFTPLFGGLIADRWLGAKRTVMIGIALMTAGHFAMIFDWSFLIALLLLVLGSGFLKGNIAAQVGHLYPKADEALRSRGYTIFSTGINIGALIGPVVCGALAQIYGWHAGFGTAGLMMLVAAVIYFAGLRHFPDGRARKDSAEMAPLTAGEWRTIGLVLLLAWVFTLFQFLAYEQTFNVGMIWLAANVDLATPLGQVPSAWFPAWDAGASVLIAPVLIALWSWQASRGREPGDINKMVIGAVVMALSMMSLAAGSYFKPADGSASIVWPVITFTLSGISFMWTWPILLAMVSRCAPKKINALLMAGVYINAFLSGIGAGFIARWYEPLGATNFWLLNAAISAAGGMLLLILGPVVMRRIEASDSQVGALAAA